ncbi:SDR family oxidoreductase [Nitrososphaera sp. AFS]|uniref:SDR family oxidoreductase n=1 Tax=Nitrososphaera sp. AFS TaxID=2301191 RepID=UPI00139233DE|nr:SDR family oxidoreductase [Nitrososphaera sp. AFS]NAL78636.1 SDR family oxidoreductase [Nitrososphaera sp. AFS]
MTSPSSSSFNHRVALVTGSSSGIGYETTLMLARNGFLTYATMRDLKKSEPIKVVQLDVTDDRSVKNAVQSITSECSKIDVLVNNAGYALNGAFEDIAMEELKAQYETNLFGVARVTQAVLPLMRKQKSGVIVNISSGVVPMGGFPGGSAYVSTKFAIEGLSRSMRYELESFGIKVILVEPGVIGTNFFNAVVVAKKSKDPSSPYSRIMEKMAPRFEEIMKNASSPELVARVVLRAITDENPGLIYLAGKDIEELKEANRGMSDEEFYTMMKKNFNLDSIESTIGAKN